MNPRAFPLNAAPERRGGEYVIYWAQANRRVEANHALLYAAEAANRLRLPLVYYEFLACDDPHANARQHTFILEGVPETARRLREAGVGHVFHLLRRTSEPPDSLYSLAAKAALVVTDDYPAAAPRRYNEMIPAALDVSCVAVDSSCIVPMRLLEKREWAAYSIRPKIHRLLPQHLKPLPPLHVARRWEMPPPPFHTEVSESRIHALAAECQIDHSVAPSLSFRGGRLEAEKRLRHFLERNLRRYASERNQPAAHATSNLSPYLHHGHISALEIALAARRHAAEHKLIADEFLEELIVRRELAFNFTLHTPHCDSLEALPAWARQTLLKHAADQRSPCYSREDFERARTHDPLWNATQKELLLRGKIHGYYRMYWGKKVIEWSPTAQDALETMIYLHDRYALDGRDPNPYTNILWCFGLHDRPWSERPILGSVRYMSLSGMRRKTNVDAYIEEINALEGSL